MAIRSVRKKNLAELASVVAAIQQEAKGLDKMTMKEINALVAEVRREKDPLYGQTRRVSLTVSERMYRHAKSAAEIEGWDLSFLIRQAIGEYLERTTSKRPHPKITEGHLGEYREVQDRPVRKVKPANSR